jgi:hypothetical protein
MEEIPAEQKKAEEGFVTPAKRPASPVAAAENSDKFSLSASTSDNDKPQRKTGGEPPAGGERPGSEGGGCGAFPCSCVCTRPRTRPHRRPSGRGKEKDCSCCFCRGKTQTRGRGPQKRVEEHDQGGPRRLASLSDVVDCVGDRRYPQHEQDPIREWFKHRDGDRVGDGDGSGSGTSKEEGEESSSGDEGSKGSKSPKSSKGSQTEENTTPPSDKASQSSESPLLEAPESPLLETPKTPETPSLDKAPEEPLDKAPEDLGENPEDPEGKWPWPLSQFQGQLDWEEKHRAEKGTDCPEAGPCECPDTAPEDETDTDELPVGETGERKAVGDVQPDIPPLSLGEEQVKVPEFTEGTKEKDEALALANDSTVSNLPLDKQEV